jgi:hypothetical protein
MIPEKSTMEIVRSEGFKESKAKIVANAAMLKILRSGIYSDKILATMRETVMNAIDSHVQAGKPNDPIEVTLPSYLDPVFKVKDKGVGLDDYGVREILFSYGDPVGDNIKNTSNDFYGCYHIGAKSPWSYVDSFEVIAIKDGVKRIYNAYIDEHDENSIAQIGEENTDEPNGVEIIVSVKPEDISAFIEKAKRLFKYLKVKPIVIGNSDFKHEEPQYLLKGNNWAIPTSEYVRNKYDSHIVIGGIAYFLRNISGELGYSTNNIERDIFDRGITLFCNIGEVDIAVSREEISYTKKTKDFIKNKLAEIVKEIEGSIKSKFNNCKTIFEVKRVLFEFYQNNENAFIINIARRFQTNGEMGFVYVFNGVSVRDYHFKIKEIAGCNEAFCSRKLVDEYGNRRRKYYTGDISEINFFEKIGYNHKIYYFISNQSAGQIDDYKSNAKKYLRNASTTFDRVYEYECLSVLEIKDEQAFNKWKVDNGVPDDLFEPFYPKLNIPKKIRTFNKGGNSGRTFVRGRYMAKLWENGSFQDEYHTVDFNQVPAAYFVYSYRSEFALDALTKKDVYSKSYSVVSSACGLYKKLGHDKPIYALKFEDIEKIKRNKNLKDKMLPLIDLVRVELTKLHQESKQSYYINTLSEFFRIETETLQNLLSIYRKGKDKFNKENLFLKFKQIEDVLSMEKISYEHLSDYLKIPKPNFIPLSTYFADFKFKKVWSDITKKYSMTKVLNTKTYYYDNVLWPGFTDDVVDYILKIDEISEAEKVSEIT